MGIDTDKVLLYILMVHNIAVIFMYCDQHTQFNSLVKGEWVEGKMHGWGSYKYCAPEIALSPLVSDLLCALLCPTVQYDFYQTTENEILNFAMQLITNRGGKMENDECIISETFDGDYLNGMKHGYV